MVRPAGTTCPWACPLSSPGSLLLRRFLRADCLQGPPARVATSAARRKLPVAFRSAGALWSRDGEIVALIRDNLTGMTLKVRSSAGPSTAPVCTGDPNTGQLQVQTPCGRPLACVAMKWELLVVFLLAYMTRNLHRTCS